MTAPDSVLLPCPFCGNADVDVMYAGEVVYVACRGCDAEGSKWRTEKTAVKHWNNRQALARGPQQAGGEDAKDAARYRWIRACDSAGEQLVMTADGRELKMGHDLDTAIDAALNGGQDDA